MEAPPAEELLKKIRQLEEGQAVLKREMSKLVNAGDRRRSHSVSPQRTAPLPPPSGRRRIGGEPQPLSPAAWRRGSASFAASHSSRLQRESRSGGEVSTAGTTVTGLSEKQCINVLHSMGQSVHIFDLTGRIIYWNRSAENLYGYSASEALGQDAFELITDEHTFERASSIIDHINMGESWSGKFPVKNKLGEHFLAITTNTPFYDDNGSLVGIVCVSNDSRFFQDMDYPSGSHTPQAASFSNFNQHRINFTSRGVSDSQQPLQAAIASKLSNLAIQVTNKVKSKIKTTENNTDRNGDSKHSDHTFSDAERKEDTTPSGASTPRGDVTSSPFVVHSSTMSEEKSSGKLSRVIDEVVEGKAEIQRILSSKAESWIGKKGISWPWKGNEHEGAESKNHISWPWLHNAQEADADHHQIHEASSKRESKVHESNRNGNSEAPGSWSSANANSTSSISSSGSNSSTAVHKLDMDSDCLDCEILWEDLTIGEQIGQGSCGTVYHALWYGSDVAVKVFPKYDYSDEIILSFKQEVSLMKRLRHPNILLFMGAVTTPHRLCIVTEFLPRGSLFSLLQKSNTKLDWRRRVLMAMDIARGMNYLHHCNPPIVHRDLKSSNLLVDKNWTVKVADFGLSRLKRETYLTTKTGKGTPQWMAPELLRNESADEKSDIYSYGVILWELVTEKIPWENLNSMQIIGAVGFMNQRLELPKDLDPLWASIINSCWHSEANSRPTFRELLEKLKDLQRQTTLQSQMQRSTRGDPSRISMKLNEQD